MKWNSDRLSRYCIIILYDSALATVINMKGYTKNYADKNDRWNIEDHILPKVGISYSSLNSDLGRMWRQYNV